MDEDKPLLKEIVKELTVTGLAAYFLTEESIKKYIKDVKLPKEVIGLFIENVAKKKEDFYGLVANEVGKIFAKFDLNEEFKKFLETHEVEVNAKFNFKPKKGNQNEENS